MLIFWSWLLFDFCEWCWSEHRCSSRMSSGDLGVHTKVLDMNNSSSAVHSLRNRHSDFHSACTNCICTAVCKGSFSPIFSTAFLKIPVSSLDKLQDFLLSSLEYSIQNPFQRYNVVRHACYIWIQESEERRS